MPSISQEKQTEIKARLRQLLAIDLKMSALRMSKILGYDRSFLSRLKKKIERENAENIQRTLVEGDLADLRSFLDGALPVIAGIVFEPSSTPKEKIAAFRAVIDGKVSLFDKKFDAGLYRRNLGNIGQGEPRTFDILMAIKQIKEEEEAKKKAEGEA